jgi:hypothetical protein
MFKKIYILIFMILVTLLAITPSCSIKTSTAEQEIESLKLEIAGLQEELQEQEEQLKDHDILTRNLNRLIKTVYYGSATPTIEGQDKNFTAFSMYYKDDFFLITAGHCIEYDGIKYKDFSFKPNNSRITINNARLIYYEADYENNRDFAIFRHNSIRVGLMLEEEDMEPRYVLGNFERKLNFFKAFDTAREGESGSPILSSGCKLVGIVIKNNSDYTPISVVTDALDDILEE